MGKGSHHTKEGGMRLLPAGILMSDRDLPCTLSGPLKPLASSFHTTALVARYFALPATCINGRTSEICASKRVNMRHAIIMPAIRLEQR